MKLVFKAKIFIILLLSFQAQAQEGMVVANDSNKISKEIYNWHNQEYQKKIYGMSVEKAYTELLKNKNPKKRIIVAVIDAGVDKDHEDLKDKMWINKGEIPNNNIDDDKNGYIDDVYGWNFCADSNNLNYDLDTYEATRVYKKYDKQFKNAKRSELTKKEQLQYDIYLEAKADHLKRYNNAKVESKGIKRITKPFNDAHAFFMSVMNNKKYTIEDIESYETSIVEELKHKAILLSLLKNGITKSILNEMIKKSETKLEYQSNPNYNPKKEDNFYLTNKYYGNNDVHGPDPSHGTHVAGIIAANRTNNIGVNGVCDNCEIMAIRAVPNGDERDYDVANAIYYAADNGANIINMSFGKTFSMYPEVVAKAIQYASSKNILLIHAAGNAALDLDTIIHYPHDSIPNMKVTDNWLTIGAASKNSTKELPGFFSNYGNETVDLFAPGVKIYSSIPNNNYASFNGTSMACPAAAGVAALVLSYYPELSALELKKILIQSGINLKKKKVNRPDRSSKKKDKVRFSELSKYGKVINAYEALKLAETWKN